MPYILVFAMVMNIAFRSKKGILKSAACLDSNFSQDDSRYICIDHLQHFFWIFVAGNANFLFNALM